MMNIFLSPFPPVRALHIYAIDNGTFAERPLWDATIYERFVDRARTAASSELAIKVNLNEEAARRCSRSHDLSRWKPKLQS
jgi:hypothetical protein